MPSLPGCTAASRYSSEMILITRSELVLACDKSAQSSGPPTRRRRYAPSPALRTAAHRQRELRNAPRRVPRCGTSTHNLDETPERNRTALTKRFACSYRRTCLPESTTSEYLH